MQGSLSIYTVLEPIGRVHIYECRVHIHHPYFDRVSTGGDIRTTGSHSPYHQHIDTSELFQIHRVKVPVLCVDTVEFRGSW